jgi:hypothetical protein
MVSLISLFKVCAGQILGTVDITALEWSKGLEISVYNELLGDPDSCTSV